LRPLLFVHPPYNFLEDEGVQNELLAGGVRDLMFGWWQLLDDRPEIDAPALIGPETEGRFTRAYFTTPRHGRLVAPFHPDTTLYEDLGAVPPDMPVGLESRADGLERLVSQLSEKGFRVYAFGIPDNPIRWLTDEVGCVNNPRAAEYWRARLRDYRQHYPTLAGCVTDGPGYGYEITPGFRGGGQLFAPLCTCAYCQARAVAMGANLDAMQASSERLHQRLHGLTPDAVDWFLESQVGVFDAIDVLFEDPDLVNLLRFKTSSVQDAITRTNAAIKEANPAWEYGICPRLPCFATIQGCNFRQLSRVTDFIQSKHYLWMGGIDGFKGTLARYAQTLAEWSPALDPKTIERLICALLGVTLPEDYRIADFDRPAPRSFFDSIVYRESRKMLQRIGDAERVSPFLGLEHGGTMLTADELRHLLQAMASAGLTRFTYYILNTIDDDVWQVLREVTIGS